MASYLFSSSPAAFTAASFDLPLIAGIEWVSKPAGWWAELMYDFDLLDVSPGAQNRGWIAAFGVSFRADYGRLMALRRVRRS